MFKLTSMVIMATAEAFAQESQARAQRRILVSIPDRKLAVMEADRLVKIFSTAVGAPKTPSPSGSFQIVNHIPHPTWYTKGKVVAPGPANPLGTRWLGLSRKGYGIHGTNAPGSIGKNASHGCIRMRNRDVEELFEMVDVGDAVEMYEERTPELDRIFGPIAAPATMVAQSAAPVRMAAMPKSE